MKLTPWLDRLLAGDDLSADESAAVIRVLIDDDPEPVRVAALLIAWKMKGETGAEIRGAAGVLRERAEPFPDVPERSVDTCGTGGDGAGTFNISTVAALVTAAAGVPVAKHGNRSVSSRCGSADLIEALGVPTVSNARTAHRALETTGFAFLFAPAFHPAMRRVAAVRRALGVRTLFNLLGPLANPARVRRQVLGVFDRRYLDPIATALRELGAVHALVVHSRDGLDEISVCDETDVVEIGPDGAAPRRRLLRPETFGIERCRTAELRGGDAEENAAIARQVLNGNAGPHRDAVVLNAGAALYVGAAPWCPSSCWVV